MAEHPSISRQHCQLSSTVGTLTITDMGSSHGTFVNKRRLGSEQVVLSDGDSITLGESARMYVVCDPDEEEESEDEEVESKG